MITTVASVFPSPADHYREQLAGRSMLVVKAKLLPVECIVRGYLVGSGWADYRATGQACGIKLPPGLKEASKLPSPLFTPSTKAEDGLHDENITMEHMVALVGKIRAEQMQRISIGLYKKAAAYALEQGIIIADTKFEFGIYNGQLMLIDEALTPDSSRFWPLDQYQPGTSPPSFDKQYLRDYLESLNWNKQPPPPPLPPEIIRKTQEKYQEAYERLVLSSLR